MLCYKMTISDNLLTNVLAWFFKNGEFHWFFDNFMFHKVVQGLPQRGEGDKLSPSWARGGSLPPPWLVSSSHEQCCKILDYLSTRSALWRINAWNSFFGGRGSAPDPTGRRVYPQQLRRYSPSPFPSLLPPLLVPFQFFPTFPFCNFLP